MNQNRVKNAPKEKDFLESDSSDSSDSYKCKTTSDVDSDDSLSQNSSFYVRRTRSGKRSNHQSRSHTTANKKNVLNPVGSASILTRLGRTNQNDAAEAGPSHINHPRRSRNLSNEAAKRKREKITLNVLESDESSDDLFRKSAQRAKKKRVKRFILDAAEGSGHSLVQEASQRRRRSSNHSESSISGTDETRRPRTRRFNRISSSDDTRHPGLRKNNILFSSCSSEDSDIPFAQREAARRNVAADIIVAAGMQRRPDRNIFQLPRLNISPSTSTSDVPSLDSDSIRVTSESDSRKKELQIISTDTDNSDTEGEKCAICLKKFRNQQIGNPSNCDHNFCLSCLRRWSESSTTCPVDRSAFNLILARNEINGVVVERIEVQSRNFGVFPSDINEVLLDETIACEICGNGQDEETLLLCDLCNLGYHMACLMPPLEEVPRGTWYCPSCLDLLSNPSTNMNEAMRRLINNFPIRPYMMVSPPNQNINRSRRGRPIGPPPRGRGPSTSRARLNPNGPNHSSRVTESAEQNVVEISINTTTTRKRNRRRTKRARRRAQTFRNATGSASNKDTVSRGFSETISVSNTRPVVEMVFPSFNLFGNDDLAYFSDESQENGLEGEVAIMARVRTEYSARRADNRKNMVSAILNNPNNNNNNNSRATLATDFPSADVVRPVTGNNLLDTILESQTLWHSKNVEISSKKDGTLEIKLRQKDEGKKPDLSNGNHSSKETPLYPNKNENTSSDANKSYANNNRYTSLAGSSTGGGNFVPSTSSSFNSLNPSTRPGFSNLLGNNSSSMDLSPFRGAPPIRFQFKPPRLAVRRTNFSSNMYRPSSMLSNSVLNSQFQRKTSSSSSPSAPISSGNAEDDVDLYEDIIDSENVETEKTEIYASLQPPPEPPALLIGSDTSSDEDNGLVIDDNAVSSVANVNKSNMYDPNEPNEDSDVESNQKDKNSNIVPGYLRSPSYGGLSEFGPHLPLPEPPALPMELDSVKDSDEEYDEEAECPNETLYSSTSINLASNVQDIPIPDSAYPCMNQEDLEYIPIPSTLPSENIPLPSVVEDDDSEVVTLTTTAVACDNRRAKADDTEKLLYSPTDRHDSESSYSDEVELVSSEDKSSCGPDKAVVEDSRSELSNESCTESDDEQSTSADDERSEATTDTTSKSKRRRKMDGRKEANEKLRFDDARESIAELVVSEEEDVEIASDDGKDDTSDDAVVVALRDIETVAARTRKETDDDDDAETGVVEVVRVEKELPDERNEDEDRRRRPLDVDRGDDDDDGADNDEYEDDDDDDDDDDDTNIYEVHAVSGEHSPTALPVEKEAETETEVADVVLDDTMAPTDEQQGDVEVAKTDVSDAPNATTSTKYLLPSEDLDPVSDVESNDFQDYPKSTSEEKRKKRKRTRKRDASGKDDKVEKELEEGEIEDEKTKNKQSQRKKRRSESVERGGGGGVGGGAGVDKKQRRRRDRKDKNDKVPATANKSKNDFTWKKLSKNTKERNYRDGKSKPIADKSGDKSLKEKELRSRKREKRKEMERYDVRKIVSDKPRAKRDEFGRDISVSRSRSRSVSSPRSYSGRRRSSRGGPYRRSASQEDRWIDWSPVWPQQRKSRSRTRRSRSRSRNRSRLSGDRYRNRSKNRDREREREYRTTTATTTTTSRKRKRTMSPATVRYTTPPPTATSSSHPKTKKRRDRARKSRSFSAARRSRGHDVPAYFYERERRSWSKTMSFASLTPEPEQYVRYEQRSPSIVTEAGGGRVAVMSPVRDRDVMTPNPQNLTVIVPNVDATKKKHKKKKDGKKKKKKQPQKEVFTSGDNIVVSVNFDDNQKTISSKSVKRKHHDEEKHRKKKKDDKKRKQPLQVSDEVLNAKPVAVIDLNSSPCKEMSPTEIISLTDSGDENNANEGNVPADRRPTQDYGEGGGGGGGYHQSNEDANKSTFTMTSSGPKTPPEPSIKFTVNANATMRTMPTNPIFEQDEELEPEEEVHFNKGPNTPPEPIGRASVNATMYDPFEPTKSRSPSPENAQLYEARKDATAPDERRSVDMFADDGNEKMGNASAEKSLVKTVDDNNKETVSPSKLSLVVTDEQPPKASPAKETTTVALESTADVAPTSAVNTLVLDLSSLGDDFVPKSTIPLVKTSQGKYEFQSVKTPDKPITVVISQQSAMAKPQPQQVMVTPTRQVPTKPVEPIKQPAFPDILPWKLPVSLSQACFSTPPPSLPSVASNYSTTMVTPSKSAPPLTQQNGSQDESSFEIDDSPYSPATSEGDDMFEPPPLNSGAAPSSMTRALPMPAVNSYKARVDALFSSSPVKKMPPRSNAVSYAPKPMSAIKGSKKVTKSSLTVSSSKRDAGFLRADEEQLKILDDVPNSAVEMIVKEKFLKKLHRQERVVEEVKVVLKPHYAKKHINKEEYKDILRRAVPKICHNKSGDINPSKIQGLVEAYIRKMRHSKKRFPGGGTTEPLFPSMQSGKPSKKKSLWG